MRAIIAEDEPLALQKLREMLAFEGDIEVVAECKNTKEMVRALQVYKPDLLFADIQMPDGNICAILNSLEVESVPLVVFTTAYDKYAVRAFELDALDYLLKPFDKERLEKTVERVRNEMLKRKAELVAQRAQPALAGNRGQMPASRSRIVIRAAGRVVLLASEEVDWIEAAANYVRFHAGTEVYLVRESLGRVEERLDPAQFVRVHRSTIVNVARIKELQPCNSGEYMIVLKNGKELSCSRGYRPGLESKINV